MDLTRISKTLSFMLRHSTDPLYIDLNGGWADTSKIIKALKMKYPEVRMETIEQIVAQDQKGRYSFKESNTKIRANQGHSIPGVIIEMERPEPPELLYHGTATRFLDSIMREGLKPMTRHYVHISSDIDTAVNAGKRHGKPVVLIIRAKDFVSEGHTLYRSSNGVWLTEEVPVSYISIQYV